ncbi:MAG: 30S ribosome-binding factor RbfA [Chloroflexota bacterium]
MSIKQERMAERIRQVMSELLMREVSDPALQGVTVTEVKIDPEVMFARIYVNALGDETRRDEVMGGLKRASSFLRREMSKRIRVRSAPEIRFLWDEGLEQANKVEQLLNDLEIPEPADDEDEVITLDLDDVDLDPYGDDDDEWDVYDDKQA